MRNHREHAGRAFGSAGLEYADTAAGHGTDNENRVDKPGQLDIRRVAGTPGDLKPPVDATDGLSDCCVHVITDPMMASCRGNRPQSAQDGAFRQLNLESVI